ncbi:MAG: choloylglycine hydrolase family protein [Clostridiales bacterium]|nr:choloylglycine hydrolase family protein [Clostridiales bacterium]
MCTAAKYISGDFYFGRTLDNDCGYGEEVVITPRRRRLDFTTGETLSAHYAFLGIATVADNFPLYYDAFNEKGLAIAGLNFVGNAVYHEACPDKINVAQYEFVPWLLAKFASVAEVRRALKKVNITPVPFSDVFPCAELHWMIADKSDCIVVESTASGLNVYDNPVGVLTNNPPFPEQLFALNNYMALSPRPPKNNFCDKLKLNTYSRGMGAMGLPGDLSSQSRFVRAAFTCLNSPACGDCNASLSQFFHILGSVEQTLGSCLMDNGHYETTIYTSCCNVDKGVFYYTSYDNRRISAVDMNKVNLEGTSLFRYPIVHGEQVLWQN